MSVKVELKPLFSRQKSFYGKAYCHHSKDYTALESYETLVTVVNHENGTVIFPWKDYSATTARHIVEFLKQVSIYDKAIETMKNKGYKSFAQFMKNCHVWNYKE